MGKAQSKRSIDITTDPKKIGEGDAVAGKVEKIEDPDQKAAAPAVNGDAATPKEAAGDEAAGGEKKESEEHSENDKDLTTEKNTAAAAEGASGDAAAAAETPKSDASPEGSSPKEAAAGEEISPLADESIKSKSKKDKVKKKWSFRSISFGKKDKQKPAKSEEPVSPTSATTSPTTAEAASPATAEPAATTNGEAEQPAAENDSGAPTTETTSKDQAKPSENGSASEQEKQANGEAEKAAPSPAEAVVEAEKPKTAEEPIPIATVSVTTTDANVVDATNTATEAAVKESLIEQAEVVTNGHGAAAAGEALTNGDSNGLSESSPVVEAVAAAAVVENIPSSVDEEPHQNGTNGVSSGSATPPPTPVAVTAAESSEAEQIKNKSQIEDIAKDLKEKNAAADQTTQELPVTCE
ncbi:A-kinase anchor protein 200 isoform X3 [Drosophila subobscura]|uniref:A-kinase anchor protein 200 isoform X3 n=1 Tax=Drosophila subobscura TaxID=7241 RepID=UPI00155A9E3F|nr:A-kinase anchor protein 200 isoform X3 [Drosophila subobscura]